MTAWPHPIAAPEAGAAAGGRGFATYLALEVRRALRSRRALVFTVLLPVALFELVGPELGSARIGALPGRTYYMISMGTYGLMSGTFGIAGRIAVERASGWNRQLRLTALTGRQYVATKVAVGFALGVPAMAVVFAFGAAHGVHLAAARWLAVGVSVALAVLPVAAAGILVGYLFDKVESAQQVLGLAFSAMGFLGGIWIPLATFPRWLRDGLEGLPFAWIPQAGRAAAAGSWVGWQGAVILAAWTVVLAAAAGRVYVRDHQRV